MQRDKPSKPVYEITGARRRLTEDVSRRQIRYAISMGIRTVCFILAIVTHGWLRAVFLVAALVLPYLSVVYANSGREPLRSGPPGYRPDDPAAIDPVRRQLRGSSSLEQSAGDSAEPGDATGYGDQPRFRDPPGPGYQAE